MAIDLPYSQLQVLVAEDNHANSLIIRTLLERAGHQVVTARNGLQALQLTKVSNYSLIILDIKMPIISGIEAVKKIRREDTGNKDTLIFGLTAFCDNTARQTYLSAGFNAVLAKPLRYGDLEKALRKFEAKEPWFLGSSNETYRSNYNKLLDLELIRALAKQHDPRTLLDIQSKHWISIQQQCARIKTYLPLVLEGDDLCLSAFRRAVHAIKTTSESIGLARVANICRELQNAPQLQIAELMKDFIDAVSESRPAIAQALAGTRQFDTSMQMGREYKSEAAHDRQNDSAAVRN